MPEIMSSPDAYPEEQAPGDFQPGTNVSPLADRAQFARTAKALGELGRTVLNFGQALWDDVAIAARLGAKRLRILCGNAAQSLRDLDLSATKLRAGAERAAAIWSRVVRQQASRAEISSANRNIRRRKRLLQSVAAAGAAHSSPSWRSRPTMESLC